MPAKSPEIYPSLLPLLEQAGAGALLVTANQRAARFLRRQYAIHMQSRGIAAWASPNILPWDAWLASLWQQLVLAGMEDRLLLSTAQEFQALESVIELPATDGSLSAHSLAELAQQAWQLLNDYAVDQGQWRSALRQRADWVAMHRWAAAFHKRCESKRWLSPARLPHELIQSLERELWQPPASVCLIGFDRFTPTQAQFIHTLESRTTIGKFNPVSPPQEAVSRSEFPSAEDEMEAAVAWARERLQQGASRLAIVTPNAGKLRGDLERTLARVIGKNNFSFSLGLPLAQYPMIAAAILLLRWSVGPLSLNDISRLLLSPYFGGEAGPAAISARARFDASVLRQDDVAQPQLTLADFASRLSGKAARSSLEWSALEDIHRCCNSARSSIPNDVLNRERTAYEWAEYFQQLLEHFQFPGKSQRDSREFQTLQRWQLLLDQLSSLAFDGRRITVFRALQMLQRLAAESIFQPENQETPIQVMGPLEAAGSLFDGLWFLGAHEMNWPLAGTPHPLLPWQTQRAAAMPHSSPDIDFEWSAEITDRLASSSPASIFSWAKQYGSEFARPSPLILKFDSITSPLPFRSARIPKSQLFSDLSPLPWDKSRGNLSADALWTQSACPFQAFAKVRLKAGRLECPEDGLDPRQRGTLLHKLMQSVWDPHGDPPGLGNSQSLKQHIRDNTLREFVSRHAEAKVTTKSSDPWEKQFFSVERERLTALVCTWLREVEAPRSDFEIDSVERRVEDIAIGDATFTLKIDRIDRLVNATQNTPGQPAELVLLDYKTGATTTSKWEGERPDEPQLPLYATYAMAGESPAAIAFAQMKVGQLRFRGIGQRPGVLPGVTPSRDVPWESRFDDWRSTIFNLTAHFVNTDAAVDPNHGPKTCRICDLAPLCRISELKRADPTDDEREFENDND